MFTELVGLASNGAPTILRATVREEKEDKGVRTKLLFLGFEKNGKIREIEPLNLNFWL